MNSEKATKALYKLIDCCEELHSLWVEESDREKASQILSALNHVEAAEDAVKKVLFEQIN